jgi:hypothetical protein
LVSTASTVAVSTVISRSAASVVIAAGSGSEGTAGVAMVGDAAFDGVSVVVPLVVALAGF